MKEIDIANSVNRKGIAIALLAAICYSVSSPLSKLILNYLSPTLMAGFLYLGAGVCMLFIFFLEWFLKRKSKRRRN